MAFFDFITRRNNVQPTNNPIEERSIVDANWNPIYGNVNFNSYSDFSTSKSLKLSAVFRCVSLISDSIASLPLIPYTYTNPQTGQVGNWKYMDEQNPLYNLLNVTPNSLMGAFTFKKMIPYHLLYKGNAYILIERDKQGKPKQLHLLNPDLITPMMDTDGSIYYNYPVKEQKFPDKDMIHIMNFTQNGLIGQSTIYHASQTLGIAYDSDINAGNFFKGGSNLSGILRPIAGVNIGKEKATKAKADWISTTSSNVVGSVGGGVVVLDSGLEYQAISISPKDSQLLESRQFNVVDVARFFNVPPALVFSQGDKFSTSEQQSMDFLQNCLSPLIEKIENEMFRKLYLPNEWSNCDLRFDVENLLRMDATTRGTYYTSMFNVGALTTNEIREKINGKSPQTGGNRSFIQVNLQPLDALISEQPVVNPNAPIDNQVK